MTALRILNLILWGGLFLYALPGALGAFGKRPRHGDAMRLGLALVGFIIFAFVLRWFVAPGSELLHQALYVLSAGVCVYCGWAARTYGRGPHVR